MSKGINQSEVREMHRLYRRGESIASIAVKVNRGYGTVRRVLMQESFYRGKTYLTKEENIQKLLKLVEEGASAERIMSTLKCDKNALKRLMQKLRKEGRTTLFVNYDPVTEEQKEFIRNNYPMKMDMAEIAQHIGHGNRIVARTIEELGVGAFSELGDKIAAMYEETPNSVIMRDLGVPYHFLYTVARYRKLRKKGLGKQQNFNRYINRQPNKRVAELMTLGAY